ncbi:hypothetical protein ACWF94_02030 [Streptomyces sp. NPDC055078]
MPHSTRPDTDLPQPLPTERAPDFAAHDGPDGRCAVRLLWQALTARRLSPVACRLEAGELYALMFAASTPYTLAGILVDPREAFTGQRAHALETALRQQGTQARVTAGDSPHDAPRITLPTVKDIQALTELVWREMPEPHQPLTGCAPSCSSWARHTGARWTPSVPWRTVPASPSAT